MTACEVFATRFLFRAPGECQPVTQLIIHAQEFAAHASLMPLGHELGQAHDGQANPCWHGFLGVQQRAAQAGSTPTQAFANQIIGE